MIRPTQALRDGFMGVIVLLAPLFLLLTIVGCARVEHDGKLRIAVIPKGTSHEFWRCVHAGAIKAEREISAAGTPLEVIWKGPQTEDDRAQQIKVVQNFIAAGVNGICLAPLDDTALLAPVQDAGRAKIPVVVFDSGLKGTVGQDFVSYVATDNYKGGELGARRLGELMGGKGKAILLRYQEGSDSTTLREQGFLDTLKKDFPNIELISSDQYAGATAAKALVKSQNLLTRFGSEIDGIFCPNESSTVGMLRALDDNGMAGKVQFVGFDSSEALVAALRDGKLHGIVLQNPINMAYLAVKSMHAHLTGKAVEPRIDTGAVMVTPENMDEAATKLLHSPDLSEWLGE